MAKKQRHATPTKNLPHVPFSKFGYYRCPKCFAERSTRWFCMDCGVPCTRVTPSHIGKIPFFDFHKTVVHFKRQIKIDG